MKHFVLILIAVFASVFAQASTPSVASARLAHQGQTLPVLAPAVRCIKEGG